MNLVLSDMMLCHATRLELPAVWPHRVLLQWDCSGAEGGVPSDVGAVLLRAVKACGPAVHPVDTRAMPAGCALVRKDWSLFDAFRTRRWAWVGEEPASVFDTAYFLWAQRATGLLIDPVVDLDVPDMVKLLRSDLEGLLPARARYAVLPGVDGAMAGIYAADPASLDGFVAALGEAASALGMALEVEP